MSTSTTSPRPSWSSIAMSPAPERRPLYTAPYPTLPSQRSSSRPPPISSSSSPPSTHPAFHFTSDFDSFGSSHTIEEYASIDEFPELPIVDPLPHLYHDPPPVPSPPSPPPPPPLQVILQDGSLIGGTDSRVLVVGWVEEHEVGRLLGEEEEEMETSTSARRATVPAWEDEDALMKQKGEEFECPVCLQEFSDPHIINCGHMFCLSCIQSISTRKCPLCRQSLTHHFPNLFAKQALSRYRNERLA